VEYNKRKESRHFDPPAVRSGSKPAFPLPVPLKIDKTPIRLAEDRRTTEVARASSRDDKLRAP
jgi:hypothetical protein